MKKTIKKLGMIARLTREMSRVYEMPLIKAVYYLILEWRFVWENIDVWERP